MLKWSIGMSLMPMWATIIYEVCIEHGITEMLIFLYLKHKRKEASARTNLFSYLPRMGKPTH